MKKSLKGLLNSKKNTTRRLGMYRRYAIKFNKKQMQFVNCVNMVERIKKARALPSGMSHLGVKRYVVTSSGLGKSTHNLKIKGCS